jgi:transketolase
MTGGTEALARLLRRHVAEMTHRAKASHIGTCYSSADLMAVLYGEVLRVRPAEPAWPARDRFILSKGHGAAVLYAALAEAGFFPLEWLDGFCKDGSPLGGHATHSGAPGVEVSTGALGHGLPIACGMALALLGAGPERVFALLGDGELNEGSTWEAALFAAQQRLGNLVAIVDCNQMQGMGRNRDILDLEPLADKWRSFNWRVRDIDGHDHAAIHRALQPEAGSPAPMVVLARTVKGKGVSFMEHQLLWHYRSLNADELALALAELGA